MRAEQGLGFALTYLSFCCRLFDLVAEDNAIVDTIYYLSRALNSEVIDLATFMKVKKKGKCLSLGALFMALIFSIAHESSQQRAIYEACFASKDPRVCRIYSVKYYSALIE